MRLASALSKCIAEGCSQASHNSNEHNSNSQSDKAELRQGHKVAVVASTEAVEDVLAPLRRCFTHELPIEAPDKDARLAILQVCSRPPISLGTTSRTYHRVFRQMRCHSACVWCVAVVHSW